MAKISKFGEKIGLLKPINPINPVELSKLTSVPVHTIVTEMLYATRIGLTSLLWSPECVRCGSACFYNENLGCIPSKAKCPGCSMDNTISSADNIMVTFRFNQYVLYLLSNNFPCTPAKKSMDVTELFVPCPVTTTGEGFRFSVGCGGECQLRQSLPSGRYRMHCPVAMTDNFLEVRRDSKEDDLPVRLKLPVSSIVANETGPLTTLSVPHGKINFDIFPDTMSFFVLWLQKDVDDEIIKYLPKEERQPYLSAANVLHHPCFLRYFPSQVLRNVSSLSIEQVVLVFTDVVGSTNLYADLGDAEAFKLIQDHFKVLFREITKHGRVVKTVGDAVMASFISGRDAILSVASALYHVPQSCIRSDGKPLQIRVGIHCGSALVVPLNGVNDYFGQTVNLAARVEAAAGASECLMTSSVLSSQDAKDAYEEVLQSKLFVGSKVPPVDMKLKGIQGSVNVTGFSLATARNSNIPNIIPP